MAVLSETVRGRFVVLRLTRYAFQEPEGPALRAQIAAALERGDVILDLAEIEMRGDISVGQRAAFIGARTAAAAGRWFLMAAPSPVLTEKLMMGRFQHAIPTFPSVDDAIAAVETGEPGPIVGGRAAWESCLAARARLAPRDQAS